MKTPLSLSLICYISIATQAIKPFPSDPKATKEAVKLFRLMMASQHKGLMFGHQDALAYGTKWYDEEGRSDVKDVCGDYPAVCGWELGHLELGNEYSLDSVYFDRIISGIRKADTMGGVNTISWHFHEHTGSWFWWGKNLCKIDVWQ